MKNISKKSVMIALLLSGTQLTAFGAWTSTNRISVAARAGFNIKAEFDYGLVPLVPTRTTPDGDVYNYDNGYVFIDVSGGAGGQTWYWGYDDSTAQVIGGEVVMTRTDLLANSTGIDMDGDTPFVGGEIVFSRELENEEKRRFGLDLGISYLPIEFENRGQIATTMSTTTDGFAYTGGTTPPTATPGTPYLGTFNGPGFLISNTPTSSSVVTAPGAILNTYSELEGYLISLRFGPYLEYPMGDDFALHLSGGLSLGFLDIDVNWRTSGASTASGNGGDSDNLAGLFLGANLLWHITEDLHLNGGVQFETLNKWEHEFGLSTARLDFTQSLYATLGLMYDF